MMTNPYQAYNGLVISTPLNHMIDEKLNEFLRSPAGMGLTILGVILLGLIVFVVVMRAFAGLLAPAPFPID